MFWRGVLGYLPVNIAQGVIGLLTIVLFTRVLSPEAYGAYALAFSVMSLTHTVLLTWTEAAMARFHAKRVEDGRLPDHFATIYRLWGVAALGTPVIAATVLCLLPLSNPTKVALGAAFAAVLVKSLAKLSQERRRAAGEVSGAALMDIVQTVRGFSGLIAAGTVKPGDRIKVLPSGRESTVARIVVLPGDLDSDEGRPL